jgi:hypothetical protein
MHHINSCESEIRECQRSDSRDSTYQDILDAWKEKCSPKITFTPTTPALATFTPFPGVDFCKHVDLACANFQSQTSSCSQLTEPASVQSCACQGDILTAASVCEIGGASCLGEVVTSAALYSNVHCVADNIITAVSKTSTVSELLLRQNPREQKFLF